MDFSRLEGKIKPPRYTQNFQASGRSPVSVQIPFGFGTDRVLLPDLLVLC